MRTSVRSVVRSLAPLSKRSWLRVLTRMAALTLADFFAVRMVCPSVEILSGCSRRQADGCLLALRAEGRAAQAGVEGVPELLAQPGARLQDGDLLGGAGQGGGGFGQAGAAVEVAHAAAGELGG